MPNIIAPINIQDLMHKKNLKAFAAIKDRIQVILLAKQGLSIAQIAEKLDRAQSYVIKWVMPYNQGGLEALQDLPRSGQPPKITLQAAEDLLKMIQKGPPAHSPLSRYRIKDMQVFLKRNHNIKVDESTIGRFLAKKNELYDASSQI